MCPSKSDFPIFLKTFKNQFHGKLLNKVYPKYIDTRSKMTLNRKYIYDLFPFRIHTITYLLTALSSTAWHTLRKSMQVND